MIDYKRASTRAVRASGLISVGSSSSGAASASAAPSSPSTGSSLYYFAFLASAATISIALFTTITKESSENL